MPTEISDWNDFASIPDNDDEDYILVNDLNENSSGYSDFSDGDFRMVEGFSGEFDGQGNEIRDVHFDVSGGDIGLFTDTGGCVIKNIILVDCSLDLDPGEFNHGLLVSRGSAVMENCYVRDSVIHSIGGQAGMLRGRNNGSMLECGVTSCEIKDYNHDNDSIGFLAGDLGAPDIPGVANSYVVDSTLDMTNTDGVDIAGFVGRVQNRNIKNSFTSTTVNGSVDETSRQGAIFGYESSTGSSDLDYTAENIYWDDTLGWTQPYNEDDTDESNVNNIISLSTSEMQGSSAENNMDLLDFIDVFKTVEDGHGHDHIPDGDWFPIHRQLSEFLESFAVIIGGEEVSEITIDGEEVSEITIDGEEL